MRTKSILGYYEHVTKTKRHSDQTKKLQLNFRQSLGVMIAEKTAFSVMRARLCEKALYLCYTKQRNKRYQAWLKKLENQV